MRAVRIASRGSKLALTQSNFVLKSLKVICPELSICILTVSTKGDRDKRDFLYKSQSQGMFTSEVENAVLDGRADIAVHSLKDMPTAITTGLVVQAIPQRENPCDGLISARPCEGIAGLPHGASVGTSSLRRIAQLRHFRDDLNCVPLRGNVETRVSKVLSGDLDAAVVACAGLNRLGQSEVISAVLPVDEFVPAPAQGALAVQIRTDDPELAELVGLLDDRVTRISVEAERSVLASLHGGCSIPLGVHAKVLGGTITIHAVLSDVRAEHYIRQSVSGRTEESLLCAEQLSRRLLAEGGAEILEQIRHSSGDEGN